MKLLEKLRAEKESDLHGGIYHKLQVDFAYNSNHIEGSRLTHDQTRYIYETNSIGIGIDKSEQAVNVNDIIETINHFRCFDLVLDTVNDPLNESYIKLLHSKLKSGIVDKYAVIGEFKKDRNYVGDIMTADPSEVAGQIRKLLNDFDQTDMTLYDIANFHMQYEKIHPFYDGNGRTGRLIMFKQCLQNNIVPFIIDDRDKMFYYMGLKEWQTKNKSERLINVFLSAQDTMCANLDYFGIGYERKTSTYNEEIALAKERIIKRKKLSSSLQSQKMLERK